jgi:GNAT superfamily N-acetyltransferase
MNVVQVELRTEVDGLVDDLADVDRETFSAPGYDADPSDTARFRDEQLLKHAPRAGFRLAIARADGELVGFAYGYTGEVGQWWTDRMLRLAPPDVHPWLGGHFELVEIAVRPRWQGKGVGSAVHDTLLAGLPHGRAMLTTWQDENRPARRLYHRKGWQPLADVEDSTLMGLRLPVPR